MSGGGRRLRPFRNGSKHNDHVDSPADHDDDHHVGAWDYDDDHRCPRHDDDLDHVTGHDDDLDHVAGHDDDLDHVAGHDHDLDVIHDDEQHDDDNGARGTEFCDDRLSEHDSGFVQQLPHDRGERGGCPHLGGRPLGFR